MDPVLAIVGLAVLAAAAAWWFLRRRTQQPVEDEWTLPPEESPPGEAMGPQLLDREALLHRDRTLDPSKWDNTPDGVDVAEPAGDDPQDLPRFFDRDYLAQRHGSDEPEPRPDDDSPRRH